jgi:Ser/Thr protein kinase RdoA (MazF antagonist)
MNEQVGKTIPTILQRFSLKAQSFQISRIGTGHIHETFAVKGDKSFVLQRVNKNVFKQPEIIASNIEAAAAYLKNIDPNFLFLTPITTSDGKQMVYDDEGYPWRLFPFFENTFTIDKVENEDQAKSAASTFAKLSKKLSGIDTNLFQETIPKFHDLSWRNEQFETALSQAKSERLQEAKLAITNAKNFQFLVRQYKQLISSGSLKLRITHNDTKINNVLFNSQSGKAVCAIDLDTLMPGYFIYDVGDMIRTFVSPVDEEEKDYSKITVRKNIYDAVVYGYLEQMNDDLSSDEKNAIPFSGMMMTYIMALRMLTDFLNGDVYYHTSYPGQNLVRAMNQFTLLQELNKLLPVLDQ